MALDDLVAAARSGDRPRFDAVISRRDPSFADRARLLYGNLSTLPLGLVRFQLQPGEQPLSGSRLALLGTTAWRQPALLTWQLSGEGASAQHTVWLTFVADGGRTQVAGTFDRPSEELDPQPIWWTGPVTASTEGDTTVLVGSGQPADRWRERAATAVTEVRRRVTPATTRDWRRTVVEVPASRRDFEAVVGAADGSYAAIAAVALAEGPSATAAVRVVVNPEVTRTLAPLGVAVVLTHEVVHVATRSVDSPAPTWAVEGFADYIALAAYPSAREGAAEPLLNQVRQSGPPPSLPDDDQFRAGQTDLAASYAGAWLACRFVAETYGPAALQRFYDALNAGRSLGQAAEDELGVPAATVTEGWRAYLRQQTGG